MDFKTIDFFLEILTYPTKTTIKKHNKWSIVRFYIISSYGENKGAKPKNEPKMTLNDL